ncbi:MAG: Hsp20/alpha crystallin family protein [Candidatus Zipacnadales bacterium]
MTSIVRRTYRPFLSRVFPEFDRLFEDLWFRPFAGWPALAPVTEQVWAPRVDVYEKDGEIVTKVELPGVAKEDVEVIREEGHLVIRAETKKDEEVEEEGYYRRERLQGRFERVIPLPADVKDEEIKAKFENGVLEVRAPKKEPEPTGRKIEVR